eukprot:480380_1
MSQDAINEMDEIDEINETSETSETNEVNETNKKIEYVVFGFVRENNSKISKLKSPIIYIILLYYNDTLLINTSILYNSWSDLNNITCNDNIQEIQMFYNKLIELGYDKYRLPFYEMLRYYLGVCGDMNRAINKWKGSIETYNYYKLNNITNKEMKECVMILSKSCHFCGYISILSSPLSPVFVLNYEKFNWNEFDDISHVIKASFYICCWMTDNIDTINNGITLMINSRGVRFHHIKKAMSVLRAVQKSLALRTNRVFFLNLPSISKNSMKLFLKIYPKHIQEKIHVSSNTESLFDVLDDEQIPQIFGGSLNKKENKNSPKSLGEILSNYIDIKNFQHFQIDE